MEADDKDKSTKHEVTSNKHLKPQAYNFSAASRRRQNKVYTPLPRSMTWRLSRLQMTRVLAGPEQERSMALNGSSRRDPAAAIYGPGVCI